VGRALVSTTPKTYPVLNRIVLNVDTDTGAAITSCGESSATAALKTCKIFGFNKDLILASMYQSNGDTTTKGENWCSGTWLNQPDVGTKVTLKGQTGFGPRGKCTW